MTRPLRLGLTGSIGMGKTTTAGMFAEADVPVWDADAAVHRLYRAGGAGTAAISDIVPEAVTDRGVDRAALRARIAADPSLLAKIEARVHPLVAADREAFVEAHADARVVLLDIPLLFESGGEAAVDAIVVVSAAPEVQSARVLARPGMDAAALAAILARQMPDEEKRRRADYVIWTDRGIDHARQAVLSILADIGAEPRNA